MVRAIYTKNGKLLSNKPSHYYQNLVDEQLEKEPQFLPSSVKDNKKSLAETEILADTVTDFVETLSMPASPVLQPDNQYF